MAWNNNITPGAPPLLWSDVYEAFNQVNQNFTSLLTTEIARSKTASVWS